MKESKTKLKENEELKAFNLIKGGLADLWTQDLVEIDRQIKLAKKSGKDTTSIKEFKSKLKKAINECK
jgi:hypothetical protein